MISIYKIDFTINIKEEVEWDRPFIVTTKFSNGTIEDILFNKEEITLTCAKLYNYTFYLEVKTHQKIKMSLGYFDENSNSVFDFENPFKSKSIELN